MLFAQREQRPFFFISIIFTLIKLHSTQTTFRSSNIELIPTLAIVNSTSNVDFLCINHQLDGLPFNISLSKEIPESQLQVSINQLNTTTIHIRLQLKNYVGIFRLLCFSKDKKNEGTRADVIVKATSSIIQLVDRCQVYDRDYIKCIIRAPNLARAIQNDFPPLFQFIEISHLSDKPSYNSNFEFLKNESTDEYLIFKWKPTVDGEFPNGVLMNMKVPLPHFDVPAYRFDMTPRFPIKPNFVLQKLSKNSIQIRSTPISTPALCEKSITSKIDSTINRTWTMIKSDRNITIINNLLANTNYRICIRCRQVNTDPYGSAECREIRNSDITPIALAIIISCFSILLIFGFVFFFCRNEQPVIQELRVRDESDTEDSVNENDERTDLPIVPINDVIESNGPSHTEYIPLYRMQL